MTPAATPLVRLSGVDVDIEGTTVLHGIDWQLERGEHWGIVGANGSGKTTFLRLIAGTCWPAPDRGERVYDFGHGPQRDAVAARSEIVLVGHELQDRYIRWGWNFAALDVVLSGVYRTDVPRRRPRDEERRCALDILERLGIEALAGRPFLSLSRGEQRRVLIARGVAFRPSVLLLDEPASGLDASARAQLTAMIERIGRELTLVCSAHAAGDLPTTLQRVLRLEGGMAVADRATVRGAALASHEARPAQSRGRAADVTVSAEPRLPLVELTHADVWLGSRHVLADLTWRLEPDAHWLVTGPNGSGKSTFLRLLHGQLRPALGSEIRWPALGNPRNVWTLRRQVAWLSAELQAAYRFPTTVRECVASGFESSIGLTRAASPAESRRVDELLEDFELTVLADRPLSSLSYGQARRALIARALANKPRLLLLDEPWEGLDAAVSALLNAELETVAARGTQLVCASHLTAHREHFTHELVLERGHIVRADPVTAHG
jgi:molybdate transport system ATP-binding protein